MHRYGNFRASRSSTSTLRIGYNKRHSRGRRASERASDASKVLSASLRCARDGDKGLKRQLGRSRRRLGSLSRNIRVSSTREFCHARRESPYGPARASISMYMHLSRYMSPRIRILRRGFTISHVHSFSLPCRLSNKISSEIVGYGEIPRLIPNDRAHQSQSAKSKFIGEDV